MTIKLALIRQSYNPFGGAERFVATALEALAEQDLSLSLLAREWKGTPQYRLIECRPFYLGRLWRDASFSHAVRTILSQEHFDLVQSHERIPGCDVFRAGDGVHAAWLAQRARQQSGFKRLATKLSPWHRYTLAAERALFTDPRLRAVICISELVRNDIRRYYDVANEKLHVIYNGVDLEHYHPRLAEQYRTPIRQQYGISKSAPVFLYVGSGFERKGVATLLEAMAAADTPTMHLLIVGSEKRLNRYREQAARLGIASRVHFTGGINDVRPYYGAADTFVLPTLYEPLSNAVLEALACGLPCILSDQCGAAELITPGINGEICDPLDKLTLATHIEKLARSAGAKEKREAARLAVTHLSLEAMSIRLRALYQSLLELPA